MRLNSFDYFRAVAILFIVAGHSESTWCINNTVEMVFANVIAGATSLFVFISGFFFHYVFYKKFNYADFIKKKLLNVFVPYLFLTVTAIFIIDVFMERKLFFISNGYAGFLDAVAILINYLWTGKVLVAYWYIPFIIVMFFLSPVFLKYITVPIRLQIAIMVIMLIVSMYVQRPEGNFSPLHSVVYFFPIYLLGITCSLYKEQVFSFISGKTIFFAAAVIALSLTQIWVYGHAGNFHKESMLEFRGLDVIIVQKIFLIFFLLSLLQKINDKEIKSLKFIASISFAVFFLHPFVLYFIAYFSIGKYFEIFPGFIAFLCETTLAVSVSMLIAMATKIVLKKKSMYFIGW